MTTLDVTDYGAAGDGSTDDTQAIQDAIDDANDGDTVYLPEPTESYLIGDTDAEQAILLVDRDVHPGDLTIKGDGAGTELKLAGGHGDKNYWMLRIKPAGTGFDNLTVRGLQFNGNRANNGVNNTASCINIRSNPPASAADVNITIKNCEAYESAGSAFAMGLAGVVFKDLTARDNNWHGFGFRTSDGPSDGVGKAKNCLAKNNAATGGYYGFDSHGGRVVIEDCVSKNENYGAAKTSNDLEDATFRRFRANGFQVCGYQQTGDPGGRKRVEFDDCVFENGTGANSLELRQANDYTFTNTIVCSNNDEDDGTSDLFITDDAHLDAGSGTELYICGSGAPEALNCNTNYSSEESTIDYFGYARNDGDNVGSTDNLTINTAESADQTDIAGVPTESDVGAWSGSTPDSDSESTSGFEDWTPEWQATTDDWGVVSGPSYDDDHAMQFDHHDSRADRYAISWNTVGTASDVEVLDEFRVPSVDSALGYHARVHLRSGGRAGAEEGYWLELEGPEDGFRLGKYTDGDMTTLARFGPPPTADTFYYRRFRAEGDTIRAKVWEASSAEPSSWDVEVTDTDHDAGWVGAGAYDPQAVETDVLNVGTGGASAPGPSSTDQAPSVAWSAPSDGATVTGTESVRIDASDQEDDSLDVQYRVDDGAWTAASYNADSGYYEDDLDTTGYADGDHTLEAAAADSAGNATTSSISVTVDNAPAVETVGVRDTTDSSTTLVGDLTALEANEATVSFQFRQEGSSSWTAVGEQTRSSAGEFTHEETGLDAGTTYEFRAVAETTDTATGVTESFQTTGGGSSPRIDSFGVTDKSDATWNWYEVDWAVSDADGNLDTVISQLRYDGVTMESETTDVSGSSASFSHELRSRGQVDEVRLLVNDTDNNSVSDSQSV